MKTCINNTKKRTNAKIKEKDKKFITRQLQSLEEKMESGLPMC
jgi:hypothetical protein